MRVNMKIKDSDGFHPDHDWSNSISNQLNNAKIRCNSGLRHVYNDLKTEMLYFKLLR